MGGGEDNRPLNLTTRSASGSDAFVKHPVRAARFCKLPCLLAVLEHTQGETLLPEEIAVCVEAFLDALPAAAHPVSDKWAFSLR